MKDGGVRSSSADRGNRCVKNEKKISMVHYTKSYKFRRLEHAVSVECQSGLREEAIKA